MTYIPTEKDRLMVQALNEAGREFRLAQWLKDHEGLVLAYGAEIRKETEGGFVVKALETLMAHAKERP